MLSNSIDILNPIGEGCKLILNIVDTNTNWKSSSVPQISKKWKKPEKFQLGQVQCVPVEENIWIVNILAQEDQKLNPKALELCFKHLLNAPPCEHKYSVHMAQKNGIGDSNPVLSNFTIHHIPVIFY